MLIKPLPLDVCRCTCLPLISRLIWGGMLDSGSVSGSVGTSMGGGKGMEDCSSGEEAESSRVSSKKVAAMGEITRVRLDLRGGVLEVKAVLVSAERSSWGELA